MSTHANAPTPDLPADRESDALLATEVAQLGPVERDYPCGYRPDGGDRWVPDTREEATHWDDERHPIYRHEHENGWRQPLVVPFYTTRLADAWRLVTPFLDRFHFVLKSPFQPGAPWVAGFTPHGTTGWNGRPDHQGVADTPELAICRAALATARDEISRPDGRTPALGTPELA